MSVPKGKNGKQVEEQHFRAVQAWIAERERLRDWDEYERDGKVNKSALAAELNFDRQVCRPKSRAGKLLEEKAKLWFGASEDKKKAQEARLERSSAALSKASSENNKLVARVAELEAENRELRRENAAYKRMRSMIESGDPGCRV
ncbi:MAG: hypothetical protein AB2652_04775 [Candidatus Thiodiazotropha endolucinida]